MSDFNFLLRTYCATFNHENYILDALKGFVMQQTNFPFVCTIVDDASTDRTAAAIKQFVSENFDLDADSVGYEKDTEYGHVTFARHKTNKNCYFAVLFLKENHYSQHKTKVPYIQEWMNTKYVALCEGDDYWTDPLKLQKQVDYMENHEECVICFHPVNIYNEREKCLVKDFITREVPMITTFEDLAKQGNYIHTPSVIYRKNDEVLKQRAIIGRTVVGDYLLWLLLSQNGTIVKLSDVMAVYRFGVGVWSAESREKRVIDTIISVSKIVPLMRENNSKKAIDDFVWGLRNELLNRIEQKQSIIDMLYDSNDYRIGNAVLKPYRWLKHIFKKI